MSENLPVEQTKDVAEAPAAIPATSQDSELSAEELELQAGEELPDREAMSLINANLAAPINAAVAANVLSDNSTAYANAQQTSTIIQHN